jgi:transposase
LPDDEGKTQPGRRASDRGAYVRFTREIRDRKLSKFFTIDWQGDRFSFARNEAAIAEAEGFDGKLYVLTSLPMEQYPSVRVIEPDIERGFRTLKSELMIAPVHHRLESRIRAHALICFLALLLHRVSRKQLKASGSELSPTAALRLLSSVQRHHVRIENKDYLGNTRIDPQQETRKPA